MTASNRLLAVLILLFVGVGFHYATTTPIFEASDELWHYPVIQHLANGGDLLVLNPDDPGPWKQEAGQPPLYYQLMALATSWINTNDMPAVRWLNPHVDNGVIKADGNINLAIHTPAERFPWHGTVLAVRLVRMLSVLMSAGSIYLTYRLALVIRPQWPFVAIGAAGIVAFTPMFVFISGAVNNDNLAVLLASATVLVIARMSARDNVVWIGRGLLRWEWGSVRGHVSLTHVLLGILLGLGALTKLSLLALFPIAGTVIGYNESVRWWAQTQRTRARVFWTHVLVFAIQLTSTFGLAALIAGWWYARNIRMYGTLTGIDAFIAVLGQRAQPAPLLQLWSERIGFMQSFWGLFGGVNVPYPNWVYFVLNTLGVFGVVGLLIFLFRKWLDDRWSMRRWLPLGVTFGYALAIMVSLIRWATDTWSSQGRLVFSAIQSIGVLFAFGLISFIPRRYPQWRHLLLAVVVLFMFGVTVAGPRYVIAPAYSDPPEADLSQIQTVTRVDFGAPGQPVEMRLLGYDLDTRAAYPGGSVGVTLYWEALQPMERDWSVFVHLQDEAGIVVAQRDTYPGLGLLATRKLRPGQTFADSYVIPLEGTLYSPARVEVRVGLYNIQTGERLSTADASYFALDEIQIKAIAGDLPNPQSINFQNQIELVGYALEPRVIAPGDSLQLTLHWRGQRPLDKNYSIFAHVRGGGETIWGQYDSWPLDGAAPTVTWTPGEIITDVRTLTIDAETPPSVYDIEIGLYDENVERLQVITPEGNWVDNFVRLTKIRVTSP